jgi:hypothetical protein
MDLPLPPAPPWRRVVLSCECDEYGNCPHCGIDYADCDCPGPTQEEEYDYEVDAQGILWARPLDPDEMD